MAPSCSSLSRTGYKVPWFTESRSPLICSIRRAIPYPCKGPRTSRVLRTISAKVPCCTSGFCFIDVSPLGFPKEDGIIPLGKQQGIADPGILPRRCRIQSPMKAIQVKQVGGPEVMELVELPVPEPKANEAVVKL